MFSSLSLLSFEKYPAHEASMLSRVAWRYAAYSDVFWRASSFLTLAVSMSTNFFLNQPSFLPSGPRKLSMLSIKNKAKVLMGNPSRQKFSRSVSKWRIRASSIMPSWYDTPYWSGKNSSPVSLTWPLLRLIPFLDIASTVTPSKSLSSIPKFSPT